MIFISRQPKKQGRCDRFLLDRRRRSLTVAFLDNDVGRRDRHMDVPARRIAIRLRRAID
jgi:hypothetical protein